MNLKRSPALGVKHLVRQIEEMLVDDNNVSDIESANEKAGEIEVNLASTDCCYRGYIITVRAK